MNTVKKIKNKKENMEKITKKIFLKRKRKRKERRIWSKLL